jgi:hypothetical protein
MVQRSSICKTAILCGLDPTAGRHARFGDPSASRSYQWVANIVVVFWTGHLFGVDGPPETFSAPLYNEDIRGELHDILECKQVLQRSGSGTSASSVSENFMLQNSAKAAYIGKPNRRDSMDDKAFACGSL